MALVAGNIVTVDATGRDAQQIYWNIMVPDCWIKISRITIQSSATKQNAPKHAALPPVGHCSGCWGRAGSNGTAEQGAGDW
jgi:hypothetical protein